ncbi:MAG: NAD(P)-dependent oxidoreductase [Betaproteobacteria bacterium]|nr:NAD(P)-dependent oxidoreductase [Betaproteobacteria bacterium]
MIDRIGLLGLGIMGSAIAPNLLRAGFSVVGFDPDPARREILHSAGGRSVESPIAVAQSADVIISLLPSAQALQDVIAGSDGLLASGQSGLILIESSTLSLEEKLAANAVGAPALMILDCPLSGTGAQALTKDLVVYASGDSSAIARCRSVFDGFARAHHDLGDFGNGTKMKLVANLLVAIHNVAAAEAMVLGMKSGLDPQNLYRVIADGAGGSRMFSVRGPQMVANHYEPATMKLDVWQKDMKIIAEFAAAMSAPTPLLKACAPIYSAAVEQGRGHQDTAAVCAVLADLAGLQRGVTG